MINLKKTVTGYVSIADYSAMVYRYYFFKNLVCPCIMTKFVFLNTFQIWNFRLKPWNFYKSTENLKFRTGFWVWMTPCKKELHVSNFTTRKLNSCFIKMCLVLKKYLKTLIVLPWSLFCAKKVGFPRSSHKWLNSILKLDMDIVKAFDLRWFLFLRRVINETHLTIDLYLLQIFVARS